MEEVRNVYKGKASPQGTYTAKVECQGCGVANYVEPPGPGMLYTAKNCNCYNCGKKLSQ